MKTVCLETARKLKEAGYPQYGKAGGVLMVKVKVVKE
jgi:hypothetical protein